jgi:MarR family transcriptional regulator, organic hydroperoxide resistance regulator
MSPKDIATEIKQKKPFASKAQEAAVALLRTADLVRRFASITLESEGITMQQYNVLRILRGAGDAGLPTLDIAERMIESTPGITRLIDRLEEKKYVSRERCATDRRQVFCRISPDGLALVNRLDGPITIADEAAFTGLTKKELDTLIDLLARARDGLSTHFQQKKSPDER